MKIQIGVEPGTSYTFSPQSGSAAFLLISGVDIKKNNVLAVINITKGVVAMMCNKSVPEYDIEEAANIIWLSSDVASTFEASDQFMILVEVSEAKKDRDLRDAVRLLRQMIYMLDSQGNVDSSNRQKVAIDACTVTVTTALATTGGANVTGIGYPYANACSVGNANPYAITASQPAQLIAFPIDQRIVLENEGHIAHESIRNKISWK